MSLDGTRTRLPDGTTLLIEVFVLPVNYPPFGLKDPSPTNPTNFAMQEETLLPYFMPGPLRVDASISMSQGSGDQFNLEMWNGRFHGPSAGNDNITLCPTANNARIPPNDDCDDYPQAEIPGLQPGAVAERLPAAVHGEHVADSGDDQCRNGCRRSASSRRFVPACQLAAKLSGSDRCLRRAMARQLHGVPRLQQPRDGERQCQHVPVPAADSADAPLATDCARQGGGGDYLSNESAYRNTLLRDTFGLSIPAGHIHTPVMTRFSTGDNALITDAMFEQYRTSIVQQARNLVFTVGRNLGPQPPLVTQ